METRDQLVETCGISKEFRTRDRGKFVAVRDVTIKIRRGTTFALVGESGAGKSTVSKIVLGLEKPTQGKVLFEDQVISDLHGRALRSARGRMGFVLQDPVASLNPRKTVAESIALPLAIHGGAMPTELEGRIDAVLEQVGLQPAVRARYPWELSGGQCQRVNIARAIVRQPPFVVLDEAVSSLDVSIRAQILNLLKELQARLGLTYLFVSHDLAVVHYMSQEMAIMRRGEVVEKGACAEVFENPRHEYTRALMSTVPKRRTARVGPG